jgi:Holliday junction resolvasome RuvABC endonuclease subunit
MKSIFIGFDFSMNKPAATILFDKNFYHMIWPSDLDDKKVAKYKEAGVHVVSRGLGPVSTKDKNS